MFQAKRAKTRLLNDLRHILTEHHKRAETPVMKAYLNTCQQLETDTEDESLEGVLDLLFSGQGTLASTTTNSIMFLGQHPDVLYRLREEIAKTIVNEDGSEKTITLSMINSMSYLNAVCKEVLRLCPPAGAGFRKALKSFEIGVGVARTLFVNLFKSMAVHQLLKSIIS